MHYGVCGAIDIVEKVFMSKCGILSEKAAAEDNFGMYGLTEKKEIGKERLTPLIL